MAYYQPYQPNSTHLRGDGDDFNINSSACTEDVAPVADNMTTIIEGDETVDNFSCDEGGGEDDYDYFKQDEEPNSVEPPKLIEDFEDEELLESFMAEMNQSTEVIHYQKRLAADFSALCERFLRFNPGNDIVECSLCLTYFYDGGVNYRRGAYSM